MLLLLVAAAEAALDEPVALIRAVPIMNEKERDERRKDGAVERCSQVIGEEEWLRSDKSIRCMSTAHFPAARITSSPATST